jgi:hypothetical protein
MAKNEYAIIDSVAASTHRMDTLEQIMHNSPIPLMDAMAEYQKIKTKKMIDIDSLDKYTGNYDIKCRIDRASKNLNTAGKYFLVATVMAGLAGIIHYNASNYSQIKTSYGIAAVGGIVLIGVPVNLFSASKHLAQK